MAAIRVPKSELINQKGRNFEPSPWVLLDQARINTFADCTEDHQFIHIDQEKAAQTPFGGTIAHGFLTLSMLSKLCEESGVLPDNLVMGINYGLNKVRFLAPVRAGKRVRAHMVVADVEQKDEARFLITQSISVEIEGEETPALVAEWLTMVVAG
ncbi:MAG: MaoC family dehydratase [Parahaliea sp.]